VNFNPDVGRGGQYSARHEHRHVGQGGHHEGISVKAVNGPAVSDNENTVESETMSSGDETDRGVDGGGGLPAEGGTARVVHRQSYPPPHHPQSAGDVKLYRRSDETRVLYRQSLNIRPQQEEQDGVSEASEEINDSVVSCVTDKFGFIHGDQDTGNQEDEAIRYISILRRRESKWLEMLGDWDNYMMKNYRKVRDRCRKGIPDSLRARAWIHLCGAKFQMDHPQNKHKYRRLYQDEGEEKWLTDIEKDLHRNFPTHELFGGTYELLGQGELYNVLKAYSVLHPTDGYCQAQAPIAALLLMNMPGEWAFWCLVSICDKYIPGYYSPGMEAIQLDGDILNGLLKKVAPGVHRHLKSQGVDPILYMTEWFLCIFSRSLPWSSVLRVWDMFICEGVKVLFRVALVLLKFSLPPSVRKKCPSMYETLSILKNLPQEICREEFLIPEILKLNITEDDMEREHRKQLERRRRQSAMSPLSMTDGGPNKKSFFCCSGSTTSS